MKLKAVVNNKQPFFLWSSDTSQSGISQSVLLVYVTLTVKLYRLLLDAKKTALENSEALPDGIFNLRLQGFKGAKIINSRSATQTY